MSTLFMVQTGTCLGLPSPWFGWKAESLCIVRRPGRLSFQAWGHIDAPPGSHTAAATWRSRRSEFSERHTKDDEYFSYLRISDAFSSPIPTSGSCSSSKGLAVSLQNSHLTGYSVRGWAWTQCQTGTVSDSKMWRHGNWRWRWGKLLLLEERWVGAACTRHTPACTSEFPLPRWSRRAARWLSWGPPLESEQAGGEVWFHLSIQLYLSFVKVIRKWFLSNISES